MPGTMSQDDLVADLKASLNDAATSFKTAQDGDFKRHITVSALALGEKRPRTLFATLALVADQADYAAPALFLSFKFHQWGTAPRKAPQPWETGYPGKLPVVRPVETNADPVTRKLYLDPPPTSAQICALGSEFRYYYYGGHVVDATANKTTVPAGDRGLLLLRAQAEAMRELALRNVMKPVMMREGLASQPRNGTPSFLYQELLKEFKDAP